MLRPVWAAPDRHVVSYEKPHFCSGHHALTIPAALGQVESEVLVDNFAATTANQGVSDLTAGNYYAGPYGVQVLELSPPP